MAQYIIYFNQQWVGDHPEEWFIPRGPLSRAVIAEMKEAGVLVFAGVWLKKSKRQLGQMKMESSVAPLRLTENSLGE